VNYRRATETAALVRQLQADTLLQDWLELMVVDNSAADPIAEPLTGMPGVRLLKQRANLGFAAGVNRGYQASRGEWLLVLNPDMVLCTGFTDMLIGAVRELRREASADHQVGVVGFQLRNRDGTPQQSVGFFPSLGRLLAGLLRPRRVRKYSSEELLERARVPWVTGGCLLIKRSCMQALGGFDEDFFLYYEDVDLCRRAAQLGWAVCYEPALRAVHLDPLQNRKPVPAPLWAITRHASLTYFRKHVSDRQTAGLSWIIRCESWLRELAARLRGRSGDVAICQAVRAMSRDLARNDAAAARAHLENVLQLARMT
jgi:GT2 family glycosyltransferase